MAVRRQRNLVLRDNGSRAVKKLESSALSVVQEVLAAVRVVKAFGQEEREEERFVRRSSAGMWARIRYAVGQGVFGLLVGLTTAVGTAAVNCPNARFRIAGKSRTTNCD